MAFAALRVVFTHTGDDVRMEAAVEVAVRVPPSLDVGERARRAPFYFELQDQRGRVLYRRAGNHPASSVLEVPTGDPSRPFTHATANRPPSGAFSVLVPARADGVFLELFATPSGRLEGRAGSIGRFDLREAAGSLAPPVPPGEAR